MNPRTACKKRVLCSDWPESKWDWQQRLAEVEKVFGVAPRSGVIADVSGVAGRTTPVVG